MKNVSFTTKDDSLRYNPKKGLMAFAALLGIGLAFTTPSRAANLLVNPGFEANNGHAVPVGWTYFSPSPQQGYFGKYCNGAALRTLAGNFFYKKWGVLPLP